MVYLEQFVFISPKISAVSTKGSPLPPPHSQLPPLNAICMVLREGPVPQRAEGQLGDHNSRDLGLFAAGGNVLVECGVNLH